MIAVGTIVVVVLAVIGWFQLRDRIADQGVQAADTCVEGDLAVAVAVAPAIAPQLTSLAQRFTDTRPVVRDHCISVVVTAADSTAVVEGLTGGPQTWDQAVLGPVPALWVPAFSDSIAGAPAGTVEGTPRSLARTPVVLAAPSAVTAGLERGNVGWADLPGLQRAEDGLDALGLSEWGGLRMHLPTGPDSHATTAALTAVSASVFDDSARAVSAEDVRSEAVTAALSALATTDRTDDAVSPQSTGTVLDELDADPAADVHAVPTTAQQLSDRSETDLTAYAPAGATPMAEHPAAVLSGQWTDETRRRAAAEFVDFASQPESAQIFLDAGFEEGSTADSTATAALSASPEARSAMLDIVQNPTPVRRATVLLDISGSMDTPEGGRSRLTNTTSALAEQFSTVGESAQLGLWVYSDDLEGERAFRTVVPTGPVREALPSGTRRDLLVESVGALEPATATSTYESVTAAYVAALEGYVPGVANSVLVVTDGPDDDPTTSPSRFLDVLSAMADPGRPVAIDVVSIGSNPDIQTLQTMSDITGGSLTTVDSSAGSELPDLLRKLLY